MATNTNSNAYTLVYATVLVVIVAFLLSFVSSSLKEQQDKNVKLDTKKQILRSVNVVAEDADAEFDAKVKDYLFKDGTLQEVSSADFKTKYAGEIKSGNYHVFVYENNGDTKYIFPLAGNGLWGAIWGYISVDSDKNTICGVDFSHDSETPGLGAEITTDKFKSQFAGKKVIKAAEVALQVVKNGNIKDAEVECDGISGGTLTSNGVNAMLQDCLKNYKEFLQASAPAAEVAQPDTAVADSTLINAEAEAIADSIANNN